MIIDPATHILGVSHIANRDSSGMKIKTDEGWEFYIRKQKLVKVSKTHKTVKFYKNFVETELKDLELDLKRFLNDESSKHNMNEEDSIGWELFNTLSDKVYVCKKILTLL